jgi:hypothetical protein
MNAINLAPSTCQFINLSDISAALYDAGMDDVAEEMHGFLTAADTANDVEGSIGLHLVKIPTFLGMLVNDGMVDTTPIEYALSGYDRTAVYIDLNN